jgi:hypothetical protein
MRSVLSLMAMVGAALAIPLTSSNPRVSNVTTVHAGSIRDVIITKENTLNSTYQASTNLRVGGGANGNSNLQLSFVNNYDGAINAYVTGNDINGRIVMLARNGQWIYPSANGSKELVAITDDVAFRLQSRGNTIDVSLPDYIVSGRVWFGDGDLHFFMVTNDLGRDGLVQPSATNPSDPSANVNWGFVELTNNGDGIWANLSYVDFVGLLLGMKLTNTNGGSKTIPGLQPGSLANICNELIGQSKSDGQVWNKLCMADSNGRPLRAIAPVHAHVVDGSAFQGYYDNYTNQVWTKYSNEPLTINTQTGDGMVNCSVSNDRLHCDGDNRDYAKPTLDDIWSCNSGTFGKDGSENTVHLAVIARLCAAFTRSTLLLSGGNVQPSLPLGSYYNNSPTHHYSRIIHKYEVQGLGYAFSYDDVSPTNGVDTSGLLHSGNPQTLTVYVGGL